MKAIPFIKMEGCGNDYVFLDGGLGKHTVETGTLPSLSDLARAVSNRHRGIGGDGLILLEPGEIAPVRMRMWNADGSEGRLCLNGLRCAARYVFEETGGEESFVVETTAGDRGVRILRQDDGSVSEVEIEAGHPDFSRRSIPALGEADELWDERFYVGGMYLAGFGVSVGNPHLVLWMDEEEAVERAPLREIGEPFDDDPRFPEGINVHLVSAKGRALSMRSWERGTGPTLACGSGAAGAYAVARRRDAVSGESAVRMPGGTVHVRSGAGGDLILRGPAREVFRGEWSTVPHE